MLNKILDEKILLVGQFENANNHLYLVSGSEMFTAIGACSEKLFSIFNFLENEVT